LSTGFQEITIKSVVKVHALRLIKYLRQQWEAAPIYGAQQGSSCFASRNVISTLKWHPDILASPLCSLL